MELGAQRAKLLKVLQLGVPVALQDMMATLSFIIITVVVNLIGLDQSAAVGVVERLIGFAMVISVAFMSALAVFAAQNMGRVSGEREKRECGCPSPSPQGLTFPLRSHGADSRLAYADLYHRPAVIHHGCSICALTALIR